MGSVRVCVIVFCPPLRFVCLSVSASVSVCACVGECALAVGRRCVSLHARVVYSARVRVRTRARVRAWVPGCVFCGSALYALSHFPDDEAKLQTKWAKG